MGWSVYPGDTRKDLIKGLTKNEGDRECLTHCLRGNVLWTVWQVIPKDGRQPFKYIGCDLLQKFEGGWGNKSMDESCGPYHYSCPLKYFDMVTDFVNQPWRDEVIHRANVKKLEIKPGVIYGLNDGYVCKCLKVVRLYEKDRFLGEDRNGNPFNARRSYLSGATFETWPEGA